MTTFSLVVPTFNRSALTQARLDSILAQNFPFEEVIVVDDGSTDNTAQIMAAPCSAQRTRRFYDRLTNHTE
jgi:glycosyltransferase involved in cell wall biosynthesis